MKDIETRDDLFVLLKSFYDKLLADATISYLFTAVARIDLEHHFPVLVDFWDMVLFQSDAYRKNAIQPHLALHHQSPLEKHHFDTWLKYFKATIDELFEGEKASVAKERATSIATVMQIKIAQLKG
jgi:hemoglobin